MTISDVRYMLTLKSRHKMMGAKLLSASIIVLRRAMDLGPVAVVQRRGVRWKLDLREGIDLSIYVFGSFERGTRHIIERLVKRDDVVFDIGANIGSHTLPTARLVGSNGRVIAFEPTTYAFLKLVENRDLNPLIAPSVVAEQVMLVGSADAPIPEEVFSSWPVAHSLVGNQEPHAEHLGVHKSTAGARGMTLDEYVETHGIRRLNLIKLDVDGNELNVLTGGRQVMKQFQPVVVMELCPSLHSEASGIFESIVEFFFSRAYVLYDVGTGRRLPLDPLQIRRFIPAGAGRNVLARPHE
jgi:FkbM family methyltransferase